MHFSAKKRFYFIFQRTCHLASCPGSPIFSTHVKKAERGLGTRLHVINQASQKSSTTAERLSVTERQSVKELKSKTAPSSHYLVRFKCDECISVVKHKNILELLVPSVGDECRVDRNGVEYTAKVLTIGDEVTVKKAEKDLLKSMDNPNQSDEENQPPNKKRRLLKDKKASVKAGQKKKDAAGQKNALKDQNKAEKKGKAADFVLDLGSPPKQSNTEDGKSPPAVQLISLSPDQPTGTYTQTLPVNPPSSEPAGSSNSDAQQLPSLPNHPPPSFGEPGVHCSTSISSSSDSEDEVLLTGNNPCKVLLIIIMHNMYK